MDLGITGRNALVCGSSKGFGKGCAFALGREGVNLVITARGSEASKRPRLKFAMRRVYRCES
jgi:3-oxoacyl-[acyl-carrier protein] reductase